MEPVNVIAFLFPSVLPFEMLTKVYSCLFCHPRQKKLLFGSLTGLNIWTQNKAHKSDHAATAQCLLCEETQTIEQLLHECPHYAAKV
jgi:hypothetical protein